MATEDKPEINTHVQTRSKFFLVMSGVLLATVLIGFSPTLYLRAYFEPREIPSYLYVHGTVLTAWFLLFLVQTSLVASIRTDVHRRLGVFGAVLAAAVVIVSLVSVLSFIPRVKALGWTLEEDLGFVAQVVWGNVHMLIIFPVFVIRAIYLRSRSEAHKRLMLLASIGIVGPALARISRFPVFDEFSEPLFAISGTVVLILAVVSYDVISRKRLHPETKWSIPFFFAMLIVFGLVVPTTDVGRSLVVFLW